MTKRVKIISQVVGWALLFLISFGALFSSDGMQLTPPVGAEWMVTAANIIGNFVVILNIGALIMTAMVVIGMLTYDEYFEKQIDAMVKRDGVLQAGENIQFKKWMFYFVSLPYWCLLIASGWITTVFIWATMYGAFQVNSYQMRKIFNEKYINQPKGDDDEEATADTGKLSDNPLG